MFLRRNRRVIKGVTYQYWRLVKTVRTAKGPRQEVVANLGKDPGLCRQARRGWEQLHAMLDGNDHVEQGELFGPPSTEDEAGATPQWTQVDLRGVRVEKVREFGAVYLALALWRRLGLHTLLREIVPTGRETVPWELVSCILTLARFCGNKSELEVAQRWYEDSALEDLLGVSFEQVNDARLYRGLDILHQHKDALCKHLQKRYEDWFGIGFEFLLYDVTSTYFEGQAMRNEKAKRGYSRDQRPDCKQVNIGLVVTPEGLPVGYEVFSGNTADVTTVKDMIVLMESKYGKANRIWVMDRGMVSEDNIDHLRERGASYIIGTPKQQLKRFEAQVLDEEGWSQVREDVEVKLIAHPDGRGQEQFVLCRSAARKQKEAAMLEKQRHRLMEQLEKTDTTLRKRPARDAGKIERRIGRWLGRNTLAEKMIEVKVQTDEKNRAVGLSINQKAQRSAWAQHAHGAYLMRTNVMEEDPVRLWHWYMQLTQAEDAFRISKNDLSLRPVFHQTTQRVEAHILVCFLSLTLWRTLEQWMNGKGLGNCARQMTKEISTVRSMDVVLPVRVESGGAHGQATEDESPPVEMRLRVVSRPDRAVAQLLQRLGLNLPTTPKMIANVVEKNRQ